MKIRSLSIAAASMLVSISPALAQTAPILIQGDAPTATVSYADLDIGSTAGRKTLEGRVARAASRLCLDNRRAPIGELVEQRHCFSTAMNGAELDIDRAVARSHTRLALEGMIRIAAK
jgi:UrcA family protein